MRNHEDCTGCGACVQICPDGFCHFTIDNHGFFYPTNEGCSKTANCHLCDDVCPQTPLQKSKQSIVIACRAKNEKIILNGSSSGAVFQVLATYILNHNGVVFGAVLNKNFTVVHQFAKTIHELQDILGSKYVQSDISLTYKQAREFIRNGTLVLFTGTPCQIVGLKSFLGEKLANNTNLISVDLICHGVASPGIWTDYITEQKNNEKSLGKMLNVTFRYKDYKMKNEYNLKFVFHNKSYIRNASKDDFYQQFFKHYILRPSCYHCEYRGLNRSWADLSLGDFPAPDLMIPEIFSPYGTSLVLSHGDKGTDYFNKIGNSLIYKEIDDGIINNILEINSAIVSSHKKPNNYEKFWNEYDNRGYNASRVIAVSNARLKKNKVLSLIKKLVKFCLGIRVSRRK